jgi:hypothetical protein
VPGEADGEIEQRLIFNDPARLDAAARGEHDLRLGVVDARRELLGGEAAEHHRMHRADPPACEHGDDRLGNHRHIDQHRVARRDAEVLEDGAERRRLFEELAVGDRAPGRSERAVVIKGGLIATAGLNLPVEHIEAGVAPRVGEPAAVNAAVGVENARRRPDPGDLARGLGPEGLRISAPTIIGLPIAAGHHFAPCANELRAGGSTARELSPLARRKATRRDATLGQGPARGPAFEDGNVCRRKHNSISSRSRR